MRAATGVEVYWYWYVSTSNFDRVQTHCIDLDEISLQYAQRNVDANHLQGRVKLLKTQLEDPLLPFDKLGLER